MAATGRLNQLSMQKEQIERRTQIYEEQIEKDAERVKTLQARILEEKRKKAAMGGIFADVMMSRQAKKKLQYLEKEAASHRQREDVCSSRIVKLRSLINKHRVAGVGHQTVFDKLRSQLVASRQAVIDALKESNELQEDGEAIKAELQELQEQNDSENQEFRKELQEIDTQIASIHQGTFESVEFVPEAEEDGPGSGDLTEEQEKELRERIHQLDSMMRGIEADIRGLYEQTSQLQEIFQLMLKRAGLATLDDLIDMFSGEESYKFEQYGYIQRVTKELKHVKAELAAQLAETEEARARVREAQASRETELELRKTEVKQMETRVGSLSKELATRREICHRLSRLSLQSYRMAGGTNPAVISLQVLLDPRPSPAVTQSEPGAAQPEGPPASDPAAFALTHSPMRTSKQRDESNDGSNDFGLTNATIRVLMGALESKAADNVMVFANLLQRPTAKAAIIQASKRPGSARHPLPAATKPDTTGDADDSDDSEANGGLPAIHAMEVAKILKSYRAGPLGQQASGMDGLGLFRLPQLAIGGGGGGGAGGSSRSLMSAFLSAPSVEEVNMDDPDDSVAVVRPLQRAEMAESKANPGTAVGDEWAAPNDSQASYYDFEEDVEAIEAATSSRLEPQQPHSRRMSALSGGASSVRRRSSKREKPRLGSRKLTPVSSRR
jgi:hypothetical protein